MRARRFSASRSFSFPIQTARILNTMIPDGEPGQEALYADPVRRYMLPVASDRPAAVGAGVSDRLVTGPMAAERCLHEVFEAQAAKTPDATAIINPRA
jgi:non-ribosomal peptide synthetase component F